MLDFDILRLSPFELLSKLDWMENEVKEELMEKQEEEEEEEEAGPPPGWEPIPPPQPGPSTTGQ